MFQSHAVRWVAGVCVAIAVLTVLRFKPWQALEAGRAESREVLTVGFLPVT